MRVVHYLSPDGRDLFQSWLDALPDLKGRVAILRRIDRLSLGLLGDQKYLRDGVRELRIDFGPGYRVYFAAEGRSLLLLLCGGAKKDQSADIERAVACLMDYRRRC